MDDHLTHEASQEIKRVKTLTRKSAPWHINKRKEGEFWEEETLEKLRGTGKEKGCGSVLQKALAQHDTK